ncbi:SMI1/KNR4 family protein [Catenulispora subtropica]|uniref:Knr4/Smi1-like domain-containing protein n=1 Tax=Catenulispora subtropica TaxID=450798 RepID=A0ABP5ELE8_9ACTN
MGTGFDVAAEIGDGLRDREEAWAFIRRFLAAWTVALTDADGCDEAELAEAEERLGLRLPTALREGLALLGRRQDLQQQDPLRRPAQLVVVDGVLVFRTENQGCAHWGVPEADLGRDDPPVVVQTDRGEWRPFLDRTSSAFVELVLTETLLFDDDLRDAAELPAALAPVLYENFRRVGFPDHRSWCAGIEGPIRFFAGPGVLIRQDGGADLDWIHVAGQTPGHRRQVLKLFPVEWAFG